MANEEPPPAMNQPIASANSSGPQSTVTKQAIVMIHGMGEQIPMDTLKSFVRTVWETDTAICRDDLPYPKQVWSKPDARTGSLELRRITTRESINSPPEFPKGVRTDFYELYWADLTAGSTWGMFRSWFIGLLWRWPSEVPAAVRPAWWLLWLSALFVAVLSVIPFVPEGVWDILYLPGVADWHWFVVVVATGLTAWLHSKATRYFGRVVRYTRAYPENIAARQAVRKRGLALLTALHDGSYQRVVIVAHSLGTILALDLLSYFWAQRAAARQIKEGTPEFQALCKLEGVATQMVDRKNTDPNWLKQYFDAQRALHKASLQAKWLISDLVTLGSPLTHAAFLLASNDTDLRDRFAARELPESPPFRETLDPKNLQRAQGTNELPIAAVANESRLMSFPDPKPESDVWYLHHAAPFAVVRWTNIYDPARFIFCGDVISGPLADVFGPAIKDVDLRKLRGAQSWRFTHTDYWTNTEKPQDGTVANVPPHIKALRAAVNLLDKPDVDPTKV
jgi:hypothetical protein